ncbi:tetratricopeptide (TPR) repeat protein [Azospirillum fermentarium]|uniref:tetratricopeptide repeat protein n=1 Tax=Azospirillum fermentarium TaxID=1233114 RepID=UPI002226DEA5|nr:tetratricopeptide repeat protein [Azospirillum fermentarium]MCW2249255.1 tetratricopeptide (TPR) repeat protein [Azospirillum fermentarium]
MHILRLQQLSRREDGRFPINVTWCEEDSQITHVIGLSAAEIDRAIRKELRWYFENFLDQLYDSPTRLRALRLEKRMADLGEALFCELFSTKDGASSLWSRIHTLLADTRIEIATGVPDAMALPWEFLQDPNSKKPLALSVRAFVRVSSEDAIGHHGVDLHDEQKLRILLVICRPDGPIDVPFRSVASGLVKELREAGSQQAELTLLRPPTYSHFGEVLAKAQAAGKPFHLVHFDGHGTYGLLGEGATTPRGYIIFEDQTAVGWKKFVNGHELGTLLRRNGVAGLVLNACQSADAADADQANTQGSLAQEAVNAGLNAVLAMRYSIYVDTAARYVRRFYELLGSGRSFGDAATAARETLSAQRVREIGGENVEFHDWSVPVAFESQSLSLLPMRKEKTIPVRDGGLRHDALPASPVIGFIGRDNTLLALDRAFDAHKIVLLHAYAGSGKTTTAIEFARWYRDTGGNITDVWFESFETYKPLARVLDRVEEAFGEVLVARGINWAARSVAERAAVALDILRQIPVLWIWDNVETVTGFPTGSPSNWSAAEQSELREFLTHLCGTQARILLTSRQDEQGWLGALPVRVSLGRMPMRERLEMAAKMADHHQRGKGATATLRPLLEWTEGNPMTLTVVVGQALRDNLITEDCVAAYIERLRAGEQSFDDDVSQGRGRSLGASLDYGFNEGFSTDERILLSLLHLFQGVVDTGVLVMMGEDWNPGRAAPYAGLGYPVWTELLNRAAELGLLTAWGKVYYGVHPVLPWFLKSRFDQSFPDSTLPVRAWSEAIGHLAEVWSDSFSHGDYAALDVLRTQGSNLFRARSLALQHGWWEPAVSVTGGLEHFLTSDGRWAAWEELVAPVIPLVEDRTTGDPLLGREAKWSLTMGFRARLAERNRDFDTAIAFLAKQVTVDRRLAGHALITDPISSDDCNQRSIGHLAVSLQEFGRLQSRTGDSSCITALQEAKTLFERLGRRREVALNAFNIGQAYLLSGTTTQDLAAAEAAYRESLERHVEDDRLGRAKCYGQLGIVAWRRFEIMRRAGVDWNIQVGQLRAAVNSHHQALILFPSDAHIGRAVTHSFLGAIFSTLGDHDAAINHFQKSIYYRELEGNYYFVAESRYNLAIVFCESHRFEDALDYARVALAFYETLGDQAAGKVTMTRRLIARIEAHDVRNCNQRAPQ